MVGTNRKSSEKYTLGNEMTLNSFSLSFAAHQRHLEAVFRNDYFNKNLYYFRNCLLASIFFYGISSGLDYILFFNQFLFLSVIRFAVVIPMFLLGYVFSFHKSYERLWPVLNNFYVILTGGGFVVMIAHCPPPLSYSYYVGVIICLVIGYTFIRSRFLMATIAGSTLFAIYITVSIVIDTPNIILAENIFFMFIVTSIGMIICYSTEISARKNFFLKKLLEEERDRVQHANAVLEQLVFERTEKLSEANHRLTEEIKERKELELQLQHAEKMNAIGTLAGGIAHDFNNILAAILGYAQLAQSNASDTSRIGWYLDRICLASDRAKGLVQQILAFSRQSKTEKMPIDIGVVIKEALTLLRASIPVTIAIRQNIELNLATVEADQTQIHQVVMNLCTNALHSMEKKGGQLDVALALAEISTEESSAYHDINPGQYLKLIVADTGHGMDADTISRIFEPYFTTKDIGEGTGMGLAMVHGIVRNHGGDIKVYSKPGAGTSFHLLFPIVESMTKQVTQTPDSFPTGNEQILFVDDEKFLVDIAKESLERFGYKVETRTSPYDALEAFRIQSDKYDLVITDMTMPEMTGKKLASEIKKIRPDIPIILCTGFSAGVTHEAVIEMGLSSLLMKPITVNELSQTVRNVLDGAKTDLGSRSPILGA